MAMSCCGQNRAAAGSGIGSVPAKVDPPSLANDAATANSHFNYVGEQPLTLRGPRTGRVYYFAAPGPAEVDPKDVAALLRTKLFVQE